MLLVTFLCCSALLYTAVIMIATWFLVLYIYIYIYISPRGFQLALSINKDNFTENPLAKLTLKLMHLCFL